MALSQVGTPVRTSYTSTRSPTTGNVAAAGVLAADDWVISWVRADASTNTTTDTANWINAVSPNFEKQSGGMTEVCVLHKVTAAEVTAGTRSWTLTNLWDTAGSGSTSSVVVRGADPTNPVDAFGHAASAGATTTHVLAGLTGTDISNTGDFIYSGIGGSASNTYSTDPTGWTSQVKNAGGQTTSNVLKRDTNSTAGSDVSSANITASGSAEYASITVAIKEPGGAAVNGDSSLSVAPSIVADGHVERHGDATVSIAPTIVASGFRGVIGDATISLPITITAVGTRTVHSDATLVVPVDILTAGHTQGNPAGDVQLSIPVEFASDGTVTRHAGVTLSVDVAIDADGHIAVELDGDATVDIPVTIEADGTLYKLVPKTGWYCFPEEDLPGPPYDVPFTPGT